MCLTPNYEPNDKKMPASQPVIDNTFPPIPHAHTNAHKHTHSPRTDERHRDGIKKTPNHFQSYTHGHFEKVVSFRLLCFSIAMDPF